MSCFVVISFEGCWREPDCDTPHYFVDCEQHGLLAKVLEEDTARFIMAGHLKSPTWPRPAEPISERVLERIAEARVRPDRLFVPSSYRGSARGT